MFFRKYKGSTEHKKPENAHAPDRDCIPDLDDLSIQLHPDTVKYVTDSQALADAIGGNGK